MDGMFSRGDVIVVGATNLEGELDEALTRPGRFDLTLRISPPDKSGRKKLFEYYLNKYRAKKFDYQSFVDRSAGWTGADIKTFVNYAGINAIKHKKRLIGKSDFDESFDRVMLGVRKRDFEFNQEELDHIAGHETGHALAAIL